MVTQYHYALNIDNGISALTYFIQKGSSKASSEFVTTAFHHRQLSESTFPLTTPYLSFSHINFPHINFQNIDSWLKNENQSLTISKQAEPMKFHNYYSNIIITSLFVKDFNELR